MIVSRCFTAEFFSTIVNHLLWFALELWCNDDQTNLACETFKCISRVCWSISYPLCFLGDENWLFWSAKHQPVDGISRGMLLTLFRIKLLASAVHLTTTNGLCAIFLSFLPTINGKRSCALSWSWWVRNSAYLTQMVGQSADASHVTESSVFFYDILCRRGASRKAALDSDGLTKHIGISGGEFAWDSILPAFPPVFLIRLLFGFPAKVPENKKRDIRIPATLPM